MIATGFARVAVAVTAVVLAVASGLPAIPAAASAAPPELTLLSKPGPSNKPGGKDDKKNYVEASVDVPDYTGVCPPSDGVTATGVIEIGHPAMVRYRWVHNGAVVETGAVKVQFEKTTTVSYSFTPEESHEGWVSFEILSPHQGDAARDTYVVTCEEESPPVAVTASVTAPDGYTGFCPPITRVFAGTLSVSHIEVGGTTVEYRWVGPDFQGPTETLTFAEGDALSEDVSHTVEVAASGTVERWIEVLSPDPVTSNTAQAEVVCEPLSIRILNLQNSFDLSACGTPGFGPAITFTSPIRVNGPVSVAYQWSINNGEIVVPGSFETTGPTTVTVSHSLPSSPLTASFAMRVSLRVTSHSTAGWVVDFSPLPCPTT